MAKLNIPAGEECSITSSDIERIAPELRGRLAAVKRTNAYIRSVAIALLHYQQRMPSDKAVYYTLELLSELEGDQSTAAKAFSSSFITNIGKQIHKPREASKVSLEWKQ